MSGYGQPKPNEKLDIPMLHFQLNIYVVPEAQLKSHFNESTIAAFYIRYICIYK